MTKIFQIKTTQSFRITFSANGTSYSLVVRYNSFSDSYYFDLTRVLDGVQLLCGITLSTGTNLLSQFSWFKFWVVPMRPELYGVNPSAANIRNFVLVVEDEG